MDKHKRPSSTGYRCGACAYTVYHADDGTWRHSRHNFLCNYSGGEHSNPSWLELVDQVVNGRVMIHGSWDEEVTNG